MVVPAFNEERCAAPFVAEIVAEATRTGRPFEVIVVDDGSADGTRAACEEIAAADPRVRVLVHERNRGLGAALRTGGTAARGEVLLWLPADGQIPAVVIPAFLRAAEGADVVASTYPRRPDPLRRRLASFLWRTLLMRWVLRMGEEIQGPVVYRRAVRDAVRADATTGLFCKEMLLRAKQRGFRIASIEIPCEPRRAGVSKVANLPTVLKTLRETWALKRRIRREETSGPRGAGS